MDPYEDPDLDSGKSDLGSSPVAEGTVAWGTTQPVTFERSLVYLTFELSGPAAISFETSRTGEDLDTIVYVYRPTGELWGRYLAKNDDGGAKQFSKLTAQLDAGAYRVLIIRKGDVGASTQLASTCGGDGCVPPPHGCAPLAPRTAAPELFIGPTQWQTSIDAAIDSATTSLDLQMYLFTVTEIADHIIAAHQRGVAVRVLLDPDEPNSVVHDKLTTAGIEVRFDPPAFSFAHAKYMVLDGRTTVIHSGNFNAGAMTTERNYAIIDHDADDVADVRAIFESDWEAGPAPDLSCTRLIVSPVNSQQRIIDHVNSAKTTLDIEVLYVTEPGLIDAIVAAATRGVQVRVMLSDTVKNPVNTSTQAMFVSKGIPTKILLANYLHAKMIQADGVALVGSENMSITSFTKNREVGALVFEPGPACLVHAQYEADWAAAK